LAALLFFEVVDDGKFDVRTHHYKTLVLPSRQLSPVYASDECESLGI